MNRFDHCGFASMARQGVAFSVTIPSPLYRPEQRALPTLGEHITALLMQSALGGLPVKRVTDDWAPPDQPVRRSRCPSNPSAKAGHRHSTRVAVCAS